MIMVRKVSNDRTNTPPHRRRNALGLRQLTEAAVDMLSDTGQGLGQRWWPIVVVDSRATIAVGSSNVYNY
jgi:hypothetical protein